MKKKNSNGTLIGLLIGIIIMLLIVVGLFTTNTLSLNTKEKNNSNETNEKSKANIEEKQNISSNDIYQEVINQYKEIINSNLSDEEINQDKYNYASYTDCGTYQCLKENKWYYTYYDIDKDNHDELLISYESDNKHFVTTIYTNDGTNIKEVAKYWSRNRLYGIYDNGLIVTNGSGGATVEGYSFQTIDKSTDKDYEVNYNNSEIESIIDMKTEKKTDYNTVEELLSDNIGNNQKVDLEKLTWNEIK